MKGASPAPRLRTLAELLLWTVGLALVGWCLLTTWRARDYQARQEAVLLRSRIGAHVRPRAAAPAAEATAPYVVDPGGLVGRVELPRIGISAIIREGTDDGTLRLAVGHIEGTPLPGQAGNVGLAGHRDTFFRRLENVRVDDRVRVTTPRSVVDYRVLSTRIVSPDAIDVLAASDGEILTLVTCYPFRYIGPAPRRFVVRAVRVDAGRAEGRERKQEVDGPGAKEEAISTVHE